MMEKIVELLSRFENIAVNPKEQVARYKEKGKKCVAKCDIHRR